MANVFLVDSDVLNKFGRAGTLSLLENLPGTLIITNEVYSEVFKGAQFAPGARAALDWMNSAAIMSNSNIAIGRTYIEPTGNDMGELSIDNILNQAIAFADPNTFAVISDSPQARIVAGFLGANGGVYYGYEFLGSLLAQGYISPSEYFSAVEQLKLLGPQPGGIGGTAMWGPPVVFYGVPFGIYDAGTRDGFGIPSGDPVGTVTFFEDGGFVVQLDGEEVQYFGPGRQVGYRDGLLVDADTGQEAVPDQQCFLGGTSVTLANGDTQLIESIVPGDLVLSYNASGTLVPALVTRTFRNEVSHLLDVHGLKVTPGHATLCGDGMFKGRHVPIIDILLSDGALVQADGTRVRMAINAPVGSTADAFVKVAVALTPEDMRNDTLTEGEIRVGTLLFDRDGVPVSVLDCLTAEGYAFDPKTGLIAKPGGAPHPLFWFGRLPRPEDYILTRSQETLEGILTGGEWEGSRSQLIEGRLRQTKMMRLN